MNSIPDNPAPQVPGNQRRTRRQHSVIESDAGDLQLHQEQTTEMSASGDLATIETEFSLINDGERISDPAEILGQCQIVECGKFLTIRTFRFCYCCSRVRCPICATYNDVTGVWLCEVCYKIVKRKRFWSRLRGFFLRLLGIRRHS